MESKSELFAWVTSVNGEESLVGARIAGAHTPFIAASRELMERLRPIAITHAGALNQPLRLVHFKEVETLERYEGGEKKAAH